jgi:high-affinity iron transporter
VNRLRHSVGVPGIQVVQAGSVDERLAQILQGRSAWLLTGLAFLMVYREVLFETLLFYAALSSESNTSAVLGGLVAATAVLALVAFAMLRFAARLPVARFFSISSLLVAILAVYHLMT